MVEGPFLVFSCSLHPESRSRRLAEEAVALLEEIGKEAELVDLAEADLPFCDGHASSGAPGVRELRERIAAAPAVVLAAPVYNYDLNAAAKNLVELTGRAWARKPVGFLCAAGGRSSYMSPMGLAGSLMFDFRAWIIPRFVYATTGDFGRDDPIPGHITTRVEELTREAVDLAWALEAAGSRESSPPSPAADRGVRAAV